MALSLSNFLICCGLLPCSVQAVVRTFDWNIGWVRANPDGLHDRPTIGINGQWPPPLVQVDRGDRIIVNAKNDLGNQTTSLHFHGLYMNGSTEMDGPVGVSQCSIPPGSTFTYNFTVDQAGTYWYHSHANGQYPDGLRAQFYVRDPDAPYEGQYNHELFLTVSDWYHDEMVPLIKKFINVANPIGAEPIPDSALMNDTQNLQIPVEPNKTYLIHFGNVGAFAGQYLWIADHTFDIVEVDGIWTERANASEIYLSAAQRCSILLTTKSDTSSNFAIVSSMDQSLFDRVPDSLNPNATSFLVYNSSAPMPQPNPLDSFDPFDDFTLVPTDKEEVFQDPDHQIELTVGMNDLSDGANYAFFNNITYVRPVVPTLYSVLSSGSLATNPTIYGSQTHTFVLSHNQIIEIVVNNHDTGKHPFHLHGHAFQAVARGEDDSGDYNAANTSLPAIPMRRDTFMVRPNGHVVLRFRADNPGVWLFHCHIEWHVDSGLIATMVEAPLALQSTLPYTSLPKSHLSSCAANVPAVPVIGNAAGHGDILSPTSSDGNTSLLASSPSSSETLDWLDLKGEPLSPKPLPAGFTAKGYVAMVFSCIAAVLGLASIVWYGLGEINEVEVKGVEKRIGEVMGGSVVVGDDEAVRADRKVLKGGS